jgi:hypothetical protein
MQTNPQFPGNGVLGNYGFPAGEVADKVTFGRFGEEYRPRKAPSNLYSGMIDLLTVTIKRHGDTEETTQRPTGQ